MKKIYSTIIIILAIAVVSCSGSHESFASSPKAPEHTVWNELLTRYVEDNGLVNYKGFISEKAKLESYLEILSANAPGDAWTENEKLAYWINAYNASTIKLVAESYPTKSIMDLAGGKPFDKKWIYRR